MKNNNSVDETIKVLADFWTKFPYLRLGQIVANAWTVHSKNKPTIDLYYLKDSDFVEALNRLECMHNESKGQRTAKT